MALTLWDICSEIRELDEKLDALPDFESDEGLELISQYLAAEKSLKEKKLQKSTLNLMPGGAAKGFFRFPEREHQGSEVQFGADL